MLPRSPNTHCLEHGRKRRWVSRAIHRIIWGRFPPIKGRATVNLPLGDHLIPSLTAVRQRRCSPAVFCHLPSSYLPWARSSAIGTRLWSPTLCCGGPRFSSHDLLRSTKLPEIDQPFSLWEPLFITIFTVTHENN